MKLKIAGPSELPPVTRYLKLFNDIAEIDFTNLNPRLKPNGTKWYPYLGLILSKKMIEYAKSVNALKLAGFLELFNNEREAYNYVEKVGKPRLFLELRKLCITLVDNERLKLIERINNSFNNKLN